MRCAALVFIFILFAALAAAQTDADQLVLVKRITVNPAFSFEVPDCEPPLGSIVSEIELVLRRSGIEVVSNTDSDAYTAAIGNAKTRQTAAALYLERPHTLTVTLTGLYLESSDTCVIAYSTRLTRLEILLTTATGYVTGFDNGGVLTWNRPQTEGQLRSTVNRLTVELANEILKARGQ